MNDLTFSNMKTRKIRLGIVVNVQNCPKMELLQVKHDRKQINLNIQFQRFCVPTSGTQPLRRMDLAK